MPRAGRSRDRCHGDRGRHRPDYPLALPGATRGGTGLGDGPGGRGTHLRVCEIDSGALPALNRDSPDGFLAEEGAQQTTSLQLPLMAISRHSMGYAKESALTPKADVRGPMSAFPPISSALHLGADVLVTCPRLPVMTHCGHRRLVEKTLVCFSPVLGSQQVLSKKGPNFSAGFRTNL